MRTRETSAAMLLVIITTLIFLPAIFNNFVAWDDVIFIVNNPRFNPASWGTVGYYWTHSGFNLYMPVTYMLWAGLARLGSLSTADAMGTRLNPYLFHFVQVLCHVVAAVAVFGIIRKAVRTPWAAMLGALVFAVHPLQVESVAFIGTMNTPLAGAMALVAVGMYLDDSSDWRKPAATVLFLAALLAKPTAVVAPAIVFLLDWIIRRQKAVTAFKRVLPWVLLAIPCMIWTRWIQRNAAISVHAPMRTWPLIAGDSLLFYLRKFFVPWPMGIDYGRMPSAVLRMPLIHWEWVVPAGLAVVALMLRKRRPVFALGIFIFFVAVLPNSGLVPFEFQYVSTTADRYIYLSMLGPGLIMAGFVDSLRPKQVGIVVAAAGLIGCVVMTEGQIGYWKDGESLFRHAIAVNPDGWTSHSNLGMLLTQQNPEEAIIECKKAVELCPSSWMAHNNLAANLASRDPDAAITQSILALQIRPSSGEAFNNIGVALLYKNDLAGAARAFAQARQLDPGNRIAEENYEHAVLELSKAATRPAG